MCFLCASRDPGSSTAPFDSHQNNQPQSSITNGEILSGGGLVSEGADAAESTATAYRFEVGQSVSGRLSSGTDEDWFAIELQAGVTYSIRLLGYGSNFLSDPSVRILDANGNQLAVDDDGFTAGSQTHERDAALTFTPTQSGTFYIEANAYSTQTGQYLLSVTEHNANGYDFTVDEIAWQLINNGQAYFGTPEAAAFNVGADNALTVNLSGLTAEGRALANAALDVWSAYTGITFTRVTSGNAEITFFDDDPDTTAYAQTFTDGSTITRSEVTVSASWLRQFGTSLDSYSFETYLHEIGHALGLAHGGNYNGSATYGRDNFYVNDSLAWSIMSYMQADNDEFDSGNPGDWNTHVNASFRSMYSPMIADMIAIQTLYGRANSAFAGNTTYGFNANTGVAAIDQAVRSGALMAMTVHDTGGIDTLDFSQTTADQVITLAAESLSSVLGGRHNLGISRGSVVENALSGSGNDKLLGNAAANLLSAGAGNDTIYGGQGGDTMYGGAGDDVYLLDNGATGFQINDSGGNDELRANASINLNGASISGVEIVRLLGSGNHNITGNDAANVLAGNAGANVLDSGAGNDTIYGGQGGDTMYGGAGDDVYFLDNGATGFQINDSGGNDELRANASINLSTASMSGVEIVRLLGSGNHNITGNDAANVLAGNAGANVLSGGNGNDTIYGGLGGDTMYGGAGNDVFSIESGSNSFAVFDEGGFDELQSQTSIDLSTAQLNGVDMVRLLGSANINITGNAANNVMAGNAGANVLSGGAGNDTIYVGAGGDTLYGGAGNDVFILEDGASSYGIYDDGGWDELQAHSSISLAGALLSGIDAVRLLGSGNHNITGNSANNILVGNAGANVLSGGDGHDTLYGGLGGDTLDGGAGNDVYILDGGASGYSIQDSGGWDEIQSQSSIHVGSSSLQGIDAFRLLGSGHNNITSNDDNNNLIGNAGNNVLDSQGGNDSLFGGVGGDTLYGGNGADSVDGGSQNDLLDGGSGQDSLFGGTGNDIVQGGAGADLLQGGDGRDVFVFTAMSDMSNTAAQPDVITDFRSGVDKIDLSQIDASSIFAGNNAFTFLRTPAFSAHNGGEVYAQRFDNTGRANDYTMIYLDVNGDNVADGFIRLAGLHNLKSSDFVL